MEPGSPSTPLVALPLEGFRAETHQNPAPNTNQHNPKVYKPIYGPGGSGHDLDSLPAPVCMGLLLSCRLSVGCALVYVSRIRSTLPFVGERTFAYTDDTIASMSKERT